MKTLKKFLGTALIIYSTLFFSCSPSVNVDNAKKVYVCSDCGKEFDTKEDVQKCKSSTGEKLTDSGTPTTNDDTTKKESEKVYVCGACDKEYATKEGALNCGETERCPKNIHKCTKCSHEYKTQEEADDCGITTECPGFGYKINYVWNDFEMLWKILKEAGQGYQSKPYYSATVTSTSSDESKIEYTASGSTYSRHYIAENKNGFYQRSFLAKLSEADITYNDIDLSTFNWIESLRLVTHVKPQKKIILPTNSVYSFSGNFIKLDNAYTTSYKLYATLRYFMDPEFKTQITELNDITEDTTIYVRLYGVLSNDKNYVSY